MQERTAKETANGSIVGFMLLPEDVKRTSKVVYSSSPTILTPLEQRPTCKLKKGGPSWMMLWLSQKQT